MASTKVLVSFLEESWPARVAVADRRDKGHLRFLLDLVRQARRADAVVLLGVTGFAHRYVDILAAIAIKRFRRPPAVIVTEATWELGSAALGKLFRRPPESFAWLARAIVRTFDGPHVTYTVLASHEQEHFSEHWPVPASRVVFTPWWSDNVEPDEGVPSDVFAGGNSLRDYGPLLAAARELPTRRFHLATTVELGSLPPNVEQSGSARSDMFDGINGASVVVVPISTGAIRASGQFTYLTAMAAGKLVIVPDAIGVRDYIEDGVTGRIVPAGDPAALREAIRWALDPGSAAEVDAIRRRAQAAVRDGMQSQHYVQRLLDLAEQKAGELAGRLPDAAPGTRTRAS